MKCFLFGDFFGVADKLFLEDPGGPKKDLYMFYSTGAEKDPL